MVDWSKTEDDMDRRIAELEEQLKEAQQDRSVHAEESIELRAKLGQLEQEVERLREERNLIADYISDDPPFDACAGVDLHVRSAEYSAERYAEESSAEDYYRAFLDCCKAALEGESDE